MTARPQSPALTPAIEALVAEKLDEYLRGNVLTIHTMTAMLRTLALAVAEEAARKERERCETAIREACSMCNGKGYTETMHDAHGCGGDEQMCASGCPVAQVEQEQCEYCGRPIAAIRGGADAE